MLLSLSQLLELLVVFCTIEHFRYVNVRFTTASAFATSRRRPVRLNSIPTPTSVFITPLQWFTYFFVPTIYILAVATAQLQRPLWLNALALPEEAFGVKVEGIVKNAMRVLACVASITLEHLADGVLRHLVDQFYVFGVHTLAVFQGARVRYVMHVTTKRRKKPMVVRTGPYTWVRHPLYTMALLQEALWSLMFWSYTPLVALGALAIVFAVKIPIEEAAIERDQAIGGAYCAYKRRVPAKLVPHIW